MTEKYLAEDLYQDLKYDYSEPVEYIEIEDDLEEPKTFNSISNDNDILQMYLKDIGKIKLLNSKEEKELGKKIKEGKQTEADIVHKQLI